VTAVVHLWKAAKEGVLAEDSEVGEEEAVDKLVVEGMFAFSFKRDSALSELAVDIHMRAPELALVAVSAEVQVTEALKEVEHRGFRLMADSRVAEVDTANHSEDWEVPEVIPSKEVRLVTVSQSVMVVKEVNQIVTVLRIYRLEIMEVRLVHKVLTALVAATLKEHRVASNSRWGVVDTMPSRHQDHTASLQVTRSQAADQATHHRRVDTTSNRVVIQVADRMSSS